MLNGEKHAKAGGLLYLKLYFKASCKWNSAVKSKQGRVTQVLSGPCLANRD